MIGELAALGAAISWTISALLYGKALQGTKPVSANIVRLSCTSVILLVFLVAIGKLGVLVSLPPYIVVLAGVSGIVGLGFGDTLYMESLSQIGVARAVPITCTYPLFNLLWAIFLAGEQVTLAVILGSVVIVLGIWLLGYEKEKDHANLKGKGLARGVALALITALLWSVSIAMMDLAVTEMPDFDHALIVNTIRASIIGILLLASSPIIDRKREFLKMSRKTMALLIAGGIVALGIGWFFLTYSFIQTLEARAVPISSTTPLFSTVGGIFLLREKVTLRNVAGSVLTVVGIFLIFAVNR